jgi:hypothetical protein
MSFGRAFDAFVGGLESGLKSGGDMQDKALARRPAKEAADMDKNVPLRAAPVQGLGTLQGRVQTNSEAIPTSPSSPEDEDTHGMYAQGGYVDPVEQDNGSYAREEAQRAQQREAVPTAPVNQQPANPPTPPARPLPNDQTLPTDKGGNIIQQTVEAVKNMPGTAAAGAIPDPNTPAQGPVHPIQEMVDLTGKSYPDLTTTIGGIRAVTGAPADRPLTTADHIDFLQRRVEYAAAHGYNMNEALKFNVQYLDNLRFQAGRTFALAGAAWDAGDGKAVQKFVQQGYGFLPDGLSAQTSFSDGALHVQAIDEKTGKPVGSPMTLNKEQFLQKAQSITGDPVSWGAAIENVPYTGGTTSAAGGRRGRGRGAYRTSDASGAPAATADDGGYATKPMSSEFGKQLRQSAGGAKADPAVVQRGEKLYHMLPADQRTPANVASLAQRIGSGDVVMKQDGLYTKDGEKVTALKMPKGVKPVVNKVADAAPSIRRRPPRPPRPPRRRVSASPRPAPPPLQAQPRSPRRAPPPRPPGSRLLRPVSPPRRRRSRPTTTRKTSAQRRPSPRAPA